MRTGIIKNLTDRGFGFITPDDGTKDLFFHFSTLADGLDEKQLTEGMRVTYEVRNGDRGLMAHRVAVESAIFEPPDLGKAFRQFRDDLERAGASYAALLEAARASGIDV